MNRNSNLSPLPFYRTIEEQSFRQCYAYGQVFPLIAPKNRFLPFQIVSENLGVLEDITVTLYNFDGSVSMDITEAMIEAGLQLLEGYADNKVVISFPGIVDKDIWTRFGLDFNNDFLLSDFGGAYSSGEGRAYLKVEYDDVAWYSEVMTLVGDLSGCLRMEWYSFKDLVYEGGRIAYEGTPFTNIMYIRGEIGRPTYDFSDNGEDRNGYYFATKQISEKTYHFSFLATEPVCDAIRIASLSDIVLITDQLGRQYQCDSFLPTPVWQPQGYLAAVDCEFQCDTMVVQPAKVVEASAMKPRFYIEGHEETTHVANRAGETFTLFVLPNLPELRVYTWARWITVEHLYANAYKVTIEGNTGSSRQWNIEATSAYSQYASLHVVQD